MKRPWSTANLVIGFWVWLGVILVIAGSLGLTLIFRWPRKVFPAFRRMMAGERGSFLRTSPEGLIHRIFPFSETRCRWGEVEAFRRGQWLGDALILRRADEIGFPEFALLLGRRQIHLSSLLGWPGGSLEDDLRKYAPQLFSQPPT